MNLYKTWSQLGIAFGEKFIKDNIIDLESVLLETSLKAKEDARLLFGMRGWLLKHHDLVNRSRLIRLVKNSKNNAVLGAIIDSTIIAQPRSGLRHVIKYCQPNSKRCYVFNEVAESPTLSRLNLEENLSIWDKWNLISRDMDDMSGAIADKKYVLKHNKNLQLRALFGPGIRAEVITYLLNNISGNAYQIAKNIGLSYEPVYNELQLCHDIQLMTAKKSGKSIIYKLKPNFLKMAFATLIH